VAIPNLLTRFSFQAIANAFFSVDSFFFLRLVKSIYNRNDLNIISYFTSFSVLTSEQDHRFVLNVLLAP